MPQGLQQVIEVQNRDSRTSTFVVVASEMYLDIFSLDISQGIPSVFHIKKVRISVNTICSNLEEASTFYIATKNQVALAMIDPDSDAKVSLKDEKIKYSENKGDKTTALRHTFLKYDTVVSETDSTLAIAFKTADDEHFNLTLFRKSASDDEDVPYTKLVEV